LTIVGRIGLFVGFGLRAVRRAASSNSLVSSQPPITWTFWAYVDDLSCGNWPEGQVELRIVAADVWRENHLSRSDIRDAEKLLAKLTTQRVAQRRREAKSHDAGP